MLFSIIANRELGGRTERNYSILPMPEATDAHEGRL
jgi:hypothetical protein